MESSGECYLDTSALIAAMDRGDSHHLKYKSLFSTLSSGAPRLVTSSLVVAEGYNWFLRKYDSDRAIQFLSFVGAARLGVRAFGIEDLRRTSVLLKKFADRKLTMADAHGLAVMQERGIKSCWSTDPHLGLTGVRLVN